MKWSKSHSIVSHSLWPHELYRPWNSPAHKLPLYPQGFSRQEYWSGLPCPPLGDLPNPGIEPWSPTLQADSLPAEPPGKPSWHNPTIQFNSQIYTEEIWQIPAGNCNQGAPHLGTGQHSDHCHLLAFLLWLCGLVLVEKRWMKSACRKEDLCSWAVKEQRQEEIKEPFQKKRTLKRHDKSKQYVFADGILN